MSEELHAALREWCDWIHLQAELASKAAVQGPWFNGGKDADLADWRTHMSIRERRVFEAAMALKIWTPPDV
jgi:hypothetical protein